MKATVAAAAHPDVRDQYDRTALVYAALGEQHDMVQLLASHGAMVRLAPRPAPRASPPRTTHAGAGLLQNAWDLAVPVQMDDPDRFGRTALHLATLHGKHRMVKLLLLLGATPWPSDADGRSGAKATRTQRPAVPCSCPEYRVWLAAGRTPLHLACSLPSTKCLKHLLRVTEPEALDMQDVDGMSAAHWSAFHGTQRSMALLHAAVRAAAFGRFPPPASLPDVGPKPCWSGRMPTWTTARECRELPFPSKMWRGAARSTGPLAAKMEASPSSSQSSAQNYSPARICRAAQVLERSPSVVTPGAEGKLSPMHLGPFCATPFPLVVWQRSTWPSRSATWLWPRSCSGRPAVPWIFQMFLAGLHCTGPQCSVRTHSMHGSERGRQLPLHAKTQRLLQETTKSAASS